MQSDVLLTLAENSQMFARDCPCSSLDFPTIAQMILNGASLDQIQEYIDNTISPE